MPIRIKVVHFDKASAEKIRERLGFISSSDFLKTLDITDIVADVKSHVAALLPKVTHPGGVLTQSKLPGHTALAEYIKGWRVAREYTGNRLFLNVRHTQPDDWFKLFELGSKASKWIAKRTFRFFSQTQGWTTIVKWRSVAHAATTGAHVGDRTKLWLEGVLVSELQKRIAAHVKTELNRA